MKFYTLEDGFEILPSVAVTWIWWQGKKTYDIQFSWLRWRLSTVQYKKVLEEMDVEYEKYREDDF